MPTSSIATLRATASAASNPAGASVISVKFSGTDRGETAEVDVNTNLHAGYRALYRDDTLAGRSASASFRREERSDSGSRLAMVKRLRQKEKWLFWKDAFVDLDHQVGIFFGRLSPNCWLPRLLDAFNVKL